MNHYNLRKRKRTEESNEEWIPDSSSNSSEEESDDFSTKQPKKFRKNSEDHITLALKKKFAKEFPDLNLSEIEDIIKNAFDAEGNIKVPFYQEIDQFFPAQERQRLKDLCGILYFNNHICLLQPDRKNRKRCNG